MRSIFVIALGLFLFNTLSAQPPTQKPVSKKPSSNQRPSNAEIDAQMKQASMEAKQMIADLEKEIVAAKERGDDPETIQEMEKRLATTKKMLGTIEKASTTGNNKPMDVPPQKMVLPKYKSPLIPIPLRQPPVAPTEAQAKDKLLWYKGKKVDDTTLVTTDAMVVRYSRKRNMIIVRPDEKRDTAYSSILSSLAKTEQKRNDFVFKMDGLKNSFLMYPEILKAYEEYDILRERYEGIIMNTIDLPIITGSSQAGVMRRNSTGRGGLSQYPEWSSSGTPPDLLKDMHDLLKWLTDALKKQPVTFTPPPNRPDGLCYCESDRRKNYELELRKWLDDFWYHEDKLLEKFKEINRYLTDDGGARVAAASIPSLYIDLDEAYNTATRRKIEKLMRLALSYLNSRNIQLEDGLVTAIISLENHILKMSGTNKKSEITKSVYYSKIEEAKSFVLSDKALDEYIEKQETDRNYDVVLEYSLYVYHENNKKMLDGNHNEEKALQEKWFPRVKKFNRFTLNIDMDFELQIEDEGKKEVMIADGLLESNQMIVKLARHDPCKWRLDLEAPDYRDKNANEAEFHIPIKVKEGKKTYYLSNKILGPFDYSGPPFMQMVFPPILISFCKDNLGGEIKDSLIPEIMRYSDADLKGHMLRHHVEESRKLDFSKEYSLDMNEYANKMFLGIKEIESNKDKFSSIVDNMLSIPDINQVPQPTRNAILNQMYMTYNINQKRLALLGEIPGVTHTGKTIIEFDARKQTVVVPDAPHSTVDVADKDRQIGIKLTRGDIKVKIVHAPQ